jgi:L-alanine-DL-glutamate epimerase-like enolase superfamily enzyme
MGAGTCLAMSGIDLALWDIRGKAVGWPLYKLLGGSRKPIPAYAGGVSLGYQDPVALVAEARPHIEAGYKAVKLRVGDTPIRDLKRIAAVRKAFGDELVILTDANIGYSLEDARQALPAMEELNVGWLEPFPPHDYRSYEPPPPASAVPFCRWRKPLPRFEFNRVIEDGAITILQPDLSRPAVSRKRCALRRWRQLTSSRPITHR